MTQPVFDLICNIIKWIFNKKYERFTRAVKQIGQGQLLTEYAQEMLLSDLQQAQALKVTMLHEDGNFFEAVIANDAHHANTSELFVNIHALEHKCVCPCKFPEENGFPCKHSFALILAKKLNPYHPLWFDSV
jgi:hypothetical protein